MSTSQKLGHGPMAPPYVLGDGISGISNAVKAVFPSAMRLMCWFHVLERFKNADQWQLVPNRIDEKARALKELADLHLAPSPEVFREASDVLMAMWQQRGLGPVRRYFEKVWLRGNPFW